MFTVFGGSLFGPSSSPRLWGNFLQEVLTKRVNTDSLTGHTKKEGIYNMSNEDFRPLTATEIMEYFSDDAGVEQPLSPYTESLNNHVLFFVKAIKNLEVGTGFSLPCKWPHNTEIGTRIGCPGTRKSYSIVRNFGYHVQTRCIDGTFYILRVD